MPRTTRLGGIAPGHFMPATQCLSVGIIAAAWQDITHLKSQCWHTWLDLYEELSDALLFYQEWQRRNKF